MKIIAFLFLLLSCIACSDSNTVIDTDELDIDNDTMTTEMVNDTLVNVNDTTINYRSGAITFHCVPAPYYFSIDSIIANCSQEGKLPDSLTLGFNNIDSNLVHCLNDNNPSLHNLENWDFSLNYLDGINYGINWQNPPLMVDTIQADTITGIYGVMPEYALRAGYEVSINEQQSLRLMVFNLYIGGCIHDLMLWEFREMQ